MARAVAGEATVTGARAALVPIEEVLLALADTHWTGTVLSRCPRFRRRLFLKGGELVGVASENPLEWLGHFLVGRGLLSPEQLHEALAGQERDAVPLGVVVQRSGIVGQQALEEALAAQASEVVCALFQEPQADVEVSQDHLPAHHPLGLRLPLPPLVLEGIRRRIRLREIEVCLGGLDVVPRRLSPFEPAALSATERRLLAAVDGQRDLEDIGLACHLAVFRVAEFVVRGVEAGFLAVRPRLVGGDHLSDHERLSMADSALAAGQLKEAWDTLRPLTARPTDRETFERVEGLRDRIAQALAEQGVTAERIPHPLPMPTGPADTPLAPEMAYVLSRVNGTWNLRQIQQIVPLEELHFGVIVATLAKLGLIELLEPPQATP
jgi:hypothetical protein